MENAPEFLPRELPWETLDVPKDSFYADPFRAVLVCNSL